MPSRPALPGLLAATLFLGACGGEAGSYGPLQVREDAFTWRGTTAPGSTVTVRNFAGGIEVRPSADDSVRVSARLEWRGGDPDASLRFTGTSTPAGVLICALWGRKGNCDEADYRADIKLGKGHDAKVRFTVEVPAGVRLHLSNIDGGIVAAATAPVRAETMNGEVRVVTSVGPVQARTLNGAVDIRMSSLSGTDSVVAKTLNGRAYIYLPAVTDATIDLSAGTGRVVSEFPEDQPRTESSRKLRLALGTGARVIHASTLNGEVALRRLDAEGRAP